MSPLIMWYYTAAAWCVAAAAGSRRRGGGGWRVKVALLVRVEPDAEDSRRARHSALGDW